MKRQKVKQLMIVPIAVTILASSASAATLVDHTGITVTASSFNPGYSTDGKGVVNGAGLNATTGVHDNLGGVREWYTGNGGGNSDAFIAFDLGATVVLDSIHVWNSSQFPQFGIKQLDVYVSDLAAPGDPEGAGAAKWTKIGTDVLFASWSGTNVGFDFETQTGITLPTTAVRHIRFESDNNFGGTTNYVGLAEVQFFAVPEPSAALLGGLGVLGLLRRRRH